MWDAMDYKRIYLLVSCIWILYVPAIFKKTYAESSLDYDVESGELDEDDTSGLAGWLPSVITNHVEDDYDYNREWLDSLPQPVQIVYPIQVRKNDLLDLDTRDANSKSKNGHYHHTSLLLTLFGKKHKIKLDLNKEILSRGLRLKRNIDETTQIIEEHEVENCYYQGLIRRVPNSLVAVDTCNGIRGIISYKNESVIIQPLNLPPNVTQPTYGNWSRHPHVIYRSIPANQSQKCANKRGMWESLEKLHKGEYLRKLKIMKSTQVDRDILAETKYMDLGLLIDHSMYEQLNSTDDSLVSYSLQLVNIIDAYYKRERIRISLMYLEIWNVHNLFQPSPLVRETLSRLLTYTQKTLRPVQPDVLHMITGQSFDDDEVGMAVPDSVCSVRAVGVSEDSNYQDPYLAASTMSHMIAHTLGIKHDRIGTCPCPDPYGCFMQEAPVGKDTPLPKEFSLCSRRELETSVLSAISYCLFKEPLEETYKEKCGNGILERGEECDCISEEECAKRGDPCCDPTTCMLKPWATCRFGDCCYNCTVLPKTHMCRGPYSECDLPEFCDGYDGECPANAVVQDGLPCNDGKAYCYKGKCPTRLKQCQMIWGTSALPGDDKCYDKFNPTGNFNGHCGKNFSTAEYLKCEPEHNKCGLLHCAGGDQEPSHGKDHTFSMTTVVSDGVNYICKILNGISPTNQLGMVADGTRCGPASICVDRKCISISGLPTTPCPVGENNLTCSGKGICTSESKCFCYQHYMGVDCGVKKKFTSPTTRYSTAAVTEAPVTYSWISLITHPPPRTKTTAPIHVSPAVEETPVTTIWLVVVLCGVVGGACIIMLFCMVCYRRRSPARLKKKKTKKPLFGSLSILSNTSSKKEESTSEDVGNRLISFGNMPSYRADKIRKFVRKAKGGTSETESEHSRGDRDSTEVKVTHTLPLARPPEKGILKRFPRSADDLKRLSQSSARNSNHDYELLTTSQLIPMEVLKRNSGVKEDSNEEETSLIRNLQPMRIPQNDGTNDDDAASDSSCSCYDKKDITPCDSENEEPEKRQSRDCGETGELEIYYAEDKGIQCDDLSSPSEPTSISRDTSGESLAVNKSKISKLKNINELLKQIDEQFNSVLRQTTQGDLSPSNSDELRGSETEVDRHFPRNSYYRQSDIEEGFSPPHRSPVLSPNPPSTRAGSDKRSSNMTSGSSPEPLPSPSAVLSPIRHTSPPRLFSPNATVAVTPGDKLRRPSPVRHSTPRGKNSPSKSPPSTLTDNQVSERQPSPSRIPQRNPVGQLSPLRHVSPPRLPLSPRRQSPPHQAAPCDDVSQHGSPRRHCNAQTKAEPPVNAVPYRGAKTANSIPGSPPVIRHRLADSGSLQRVGTPSPPAVRRKPPPAEVGSSSPPSLSKKPKVIVSSNTPSVLSTFNPKPSGVSSHDQQSISEGYHSDRADTDDTIIIREIPISRATDIEVTPHSNSSYYQKVPASFSNDSLRL